MIRVAFILALAVGLSACASPRAGICVTGAVQPITEPMIADKSVAGRKALEAAVRWRMRIERYGPLTAGAAIALTLIWWFA